MFWGGQLSFTKPSGDGFTGHPYAGGDIGKAIQKAYVGGTGSNVGVYFGTGGTVPKVSDYTLESPITSGLAITNPSIENTGYDPKFPMETDGKKYSLVPTYIVQNTSSAEINIREVGVFGAVCTSSSSNSSTINVLFERTVLSEPINIQPGKVKLITYRLTFNHG